MGWDSWVHKYIGDYTTPDYYYLCPGGVGPDINSVSKVEACPVDVHMTGIPKKKISWMYDAQGNLDWAIRTYAMVAPNGTWQNGYQRPYGSGLPTLTMGVGVDWNMGSAATAPWGRLPNGKDLSYRGAVVQDPSGTIMLVEEPNYQGSAANEWPAFCIGPQGNDTIHQINPNDLNGAQNQGWIVYAGQSKRFNYVFHDGHVQSLKIEQTVGKGTLANPLGMWTVTAGD